MYTACVSTEIHKFEVVERIASFGNVECYYRDYYLFKYSYVLVSLFTDLFS